MTAFQMAAELGFDGVEVMVWTDPVSQDADALRGLSDRYGVPILAIHAPCLLLTQRVWSTDPWAKLVRSQEAAERVGASTVVAPRRVETEPTGSATSTVSSLTRTSYVGWHCS